MNKKNIKDLYRLANYSYEKNNVDLSPNYESYFKSLFVNLKASMKDFSKIYYILENKLIFLEKNKLSCFFKSFSMELNFMQSILIENNKTTNDSFETIKKYFNVLSENVYKEKKYSTKYIFEELLSLQEEYKDKFDYNLKEKTFSVITNEICLQDDNGISYDLGEFEIIVRLDKNIFSIIAKNPYPAKGDESVTHPHVSDGKLCQGEAAESIGFCFFEGRYTDLILIITSVLNTYNPRNPFVSLENWENQETCYDCNSSDEIGSFYSCNYCDELFCNDCTYSCNGCKDYFCSSHTDQCNSCSDRYCKSCLNKCRSCGYLCCGSCSDKYCQDCGYNYCNDCLTECKKCGDNHCDECMNKCNQCKDNCCKDCLNMCEVCEYNYCGDCITKCKGCGGDYCDDCLTKCEGCEDYICEKCSNKCEECGCNYCPICLKECDDCKYKHCENCLKKNSDGNDCCTICLEERNNCEKQICLF